MKQPSSGKPHSRLEADALLIFSLWRQSTNERLPESDFHVDWIGAISLIEICSGRHRNERTKIVIISFVPASLP